PVLGGTGGDGEDTTVTYGEDVYIGHRGLGSIPSTSGTTILLLGCVEGGDAEGGDQNIKGGPPGIAVRETATSGQGGNGGASAEAPGAVGPSSPIGTNTSADGEAGSFSSGGSGAINFNNSPADGNTGGAGGDGFLWVYEYSAAGDT